MGGSNQSASSKTPNAERVPQRRGPATRAVDLRVSLNLSFPFQMYNWLSYFHHLSILSMDMQVHSAFSVLPPTVCYLTTASLASAPMPLIALRRNADNHTHNIYINLKPSNWIKLEVNLCQIAKSFLGPGGVHSTLRMLPKWLCATEQGGPS